MHWQHVGNASATCWQHVGNALATHWQWRWQHVGNTLEHVGNALTMGGQQVGNATWLNVAQRCQLVETVHQIRRVVEVIVYLLGF